MPRTNIVNALDVELAVAVAAIDLEITVDVATQLPVVPFYLVVDPFNDTTLREYMLCTAVAGPVLTVTRLLAGSESDVHDIGDVVRITIAAQHIEDIWDALDPLAPQTFLHGDLSDVSTSQHHQRYTDGEAIAAVGDPGAGVYLPLDGITPMAGTLNMGSNDINAINLLNAINIQFVNAAGAIKDNTGQNRIVVNAGGDLLLVNSTGGNRIIIGTVVTLGSALAMGANLITGVADPAAPQDAATRAYVDSVVVPPIPQTFLHADLTDVGSLPSAHHAKYLDSEAVAAMGVEGDGNPLNHTKAVAGVPEAPNDAQLYGRQSLAWVVVPAGIGDAPSNGNPHGRQDGAWEQTVRKSGDNMTGSLGLNAFNIENVRTIRGDDAGNLRLETRIGASMTLGTKDGTTNYMYLDFEKAILTQVTEFRLGAWASTHAVLGTPFDFQFHNSQVTDSGSEPGAIGIVGDIVFNYGGGTPRGVWIKSSFGGNANNWHHIAGEFL